MDEQEPEIADRDPEPGYLHKEDIEEVGLFGEDGGCGAVLGEGLRGGVIWGGARCGREEGVEGAKEEDGRIDGKE